MRMLMHVKLPHEPFIADVTFHLVMTPDELARAGLDAIGKQWG